MIAVQRWALRLASWAVTLVLAGLATASAGTPAAADMSADTDREMVDRVVVFGVPGLRWSDISAEATPEIWRLLDEGSAAAMSVRTVRPSACPIDGWLTLGAGARATAPRADGECMAPPQPVGLRAASASVPEFEEIVAENRDYFYDPRFGALAEEVRNAGGCVTAAGPGAAVAVADGAGRIDRYVPDLSVLGPEGVLDACAVTIVDLGSVPDDESPRRQLLRQADNEIGRITAGLRPDATVVVAGIADRSSRPHLGGLVVKSPDHGGGWLTASSTRHPGLVQVTDLAPTVLDAVGITPPDAMVGAVMRTAEGRPAETHVAWQRLAQEDVAAQTIRDYAGIFFVLLELGQILLYSVIGWLLWQRRRGASTTADGRLGRVLYAGALFIASAPAASFLANTVPWWRAGHPAPVLGGLVLAWTIAITVVALAGPWRRWHLLAPAGFIAAATLVVLTADVVVGGSRLQLSSLYGLSPLIAGRFYGFGNVAFAVFAMAALFTALSTAAHWLARDRRRAALISVGVIAMVTVLADGWPTLGADFGGVVAMVPGFGLLAAAVAGLRLSVRRLMSIAAGTVVAVSAIALVDWLRPAEQRSHLGRFVQQILDGEAGNILQRKLDANIATFTRGPEGVLIPIILVVVAYLLARPERLRTFNLAIGRVPILRPGLVAMYVTAILGFAVNDSGIQVSAVCLTVATPLVVASCARLLSAPAKQPPAATRVDARA